MPESARLRVPPAPHGVWARLRIARRMACGCANTELREADAEPGSEANRPRSLVVYAKPK